MIAALTVSLAIMVIYCWYLFYANYRLECERAQALARARFAQRQIERIKEELGFAWPEISPLGGALLTSLATGIPWNARVAHRAMRAKRYVFPDAEGLAKPSGAIDPITQRVPHQNIGSYTRATGGTA